MAIYKCKMCGGTLEFEQGATVGVCDHCGTKQTLPRLDDERRTNLYDRANHFRRNNDYDKAAGIYEKILNEDATDAEAYWSLVLCRYGIEYVEDPATHRRVPTVNRAQFTSVFDDGNYKSALHYADALQRALYEEEAAAINEIQKGILAISQKEEPFDVFICYKETDANGRRTQDSVLANDLYHQLTQEGFKVFFSRITLEDKLGTAYEPYIFAALNSAKVMVVLGTKPEHFNAVWVKNEWSRYLALVKQSGGKKVLIPAYRDMDPYDLPEEFSHLQAQDMSKLGFMQDLIRGIKKLAAVDTPKAVKEPVVISSGNASAAQPLIDRGFMALEDGEWEKADDFFEQALNLDAKNGDAYLGKFLASVKHASLQSFLKERSDASYIDYHTEHSCKEAFRPNEDALRKTVAQYAVPGYLEEARMLRELMEFDVYYDSQAGLLERYISDVRGGWASNKDLIRAKQYGRPEIGAQLNAFFEKLKEELTQARQADAETVEQKKHEYKQFVSDYKAKAAQMCEDAKRDAARDAALLQERVEEAKRRTAEERAQKERELDEKYQNASALVAKANTLESYDKVIESFQEISFYRDSEEQIRILQDRRARIEAQMEKERAKKKKRNTIIAVCASVISVVVIVLIITVVIPSKKYDRAVSLIAEGNSFDALVLFNEIATFRDSKDQAQALIEQMRIRAHIKTISAGGGHTIAVKNDGTVVSTKYKSSTEQFVVNDKGQCNVSSWASIIAVSAGFEYSLGLKDDGTVVAAGDNEYGQCDVSEWRDIVSISANHHHSLGLKTDGHVVVAGVEDKENGQCNVSGWSDIVAVAAGCYHSLGLKSNGTVVAVGDNSSGQCGVSEWTDIIAIDAGFNYSVGLKRDGTVVVTKYTGNKEYDYGQFNVSKWTDIVDVEIGDLHTIGLKSDGTVVGAGPEELCFPGVEKNSNVVAISAGDHHTVVLKSDGTASSCGIENNGQCSDVRKWKDLKVSNVLNTNK